MNDVQQTNQKGVFLRLLTYTKPYKKSLTIAFILLILTTVGQLIGPFLVKVFIDDYLTPRHFPYDALVGLASVYLGVHFLSVVFNYFQLMMFQKIALFIIQDLRVGVFSKVQHLGLKFFDKASGGSLVSRITNDTEAIKDLFVSVLSVFVQNIVFLVGVFIAMFILDIKLALFCLLLLPIILLIMQTYRKLSSKFYHRMREKLSQLNAKISENIQGMNIVQVFRQEKRLTNEFEAINEDHYQAGVRNIKLDGLLLRPAVDLVYIMTIIFVLSFFGVKSFAGPVEIGVIFAFVNYLERFFEPVNQMMMRLSMFQQAIVSAERVFGLLDEKEQAPNSKGEENPNISNGEIEFKNVSFSYDGNRDVLKNISFTAKKGETVALVGHTGSGKSSIINLLMRFYNFQRGDILIDGKSIKKYQNNELRKKVGLVLQDPFIFVGDIKQNIRLYNESISDEEVIEAAKFVQAHNFISELPEGYNHQTEERGASFSSGQRQLIAFARTIVMKPKVLILDEATASIDTETEEYIQQALSKMRKGRTTIAIAHRLSTIQDAEQILVLHKGEIVERGTHQQLLSQQGLYHKMFLLQQGSVDKLTQNV